METRALPFEIEMCLEPLPGSLDFNQFGRDEPSKLSRDTLVLQYRLARETQYARFQARVRAALQKSMVKEVSLHDLGQMVAPLAWSAEAFEALVAAGVVRKTASGLVCLSDDDTRAGAA